MAKYRLKNSNNFVNCEILNEHAGDYIVRFKNGVIQNVRKERVSHLDMIDEAVLDGIKDRVSKYGRSFISKTKNIAKKIKGFIVNAFFNNGYIFFKNEEGETIPAVSPVNTMLFASNTDLELNFYPGTDLIKTCNAVGVDAEASQNYQFRGKYEGAFFFDNVNESVSNNDCVFSKIFEAEEESKHGFINSIGKWLPDENKVQLSNITAGGTMESFNADFISKLIIKEYKRRLKLKVDDKNPTIAPLFIWGAPGIGKSAILNNINNSLSVDGSHPTVLSLCCGSVGKQDLTLPVKSSKQIVQDVIDNMTVDPNGKQVNRRGLAMKDITEDSYVTDLPKSWLPVYNAGTTKYPELANVICNNGIVEKNPETGEFEIIDEGSGGIFFMDEFTRIKQAGSDALMNVLTDRTLGNSGLKFGTKWVIVAAGNRQQDMSRESAEGSIAWEIAKSSRFNFINFVPNPKDWFEYASAKRDDDTEDPYELIADSSDGIIKNVIEPIRSYVKYSLQTSGGYDAKSGTGDFGDYYEMWNHTPIDDVNMDDDDTKIPAPDYGKACPRSWEQLSTELEMLYLEDGIPLEDVDNKELAKVAKGIVGGGPAERFAAFIHTRSIFSKEDAKNAWDGNIDQIRKLFEKIKSFDEISRISLFNNLVIPALINTLGSINFSGLSEKAKNERVINIVNFICVYSSNDIKLVDFNQTGFNLSNLRTVVSRTYTACLSDFYGEMDKKLPDNQKLKSASSSCWNAVREHTAKISKNYKFD